MKVFYSELAASPGYYSFGYSVYGIVEEGDSLDECYERGFLPFIGARRQEKRMMYQTRSVRALAQEFEEKHYHRYALKKSEALRGPGIEIIEHERASFIDRETLREFFARYFAYRFGRRAMPHERLDAILASPLLTHIVEYRLDGRAIGYVLETRGEGFSHVWYYAYGKEHEKQCLGLYLCIDFVKRTQKAGRRYAYFGATYGSWMKYKTHFEPLEYWNGESWIRDPKGKSLKRLLAADSLRQVAFNDAWREEREPFHPSPYPFKSIRAELRFLMLIMEATPRVFVTLTVFLALASLSILFTTLLP